MQLNLVSIILTIGYPVFLVCLFVICQMQVQVDALKVLMAIIKYSFRI